MMNFGNMGWGMVFWWIGGLIMMVLFVWLLYTFFGRNSFENKQHLENARDIVRKRYARSEITKEEYNHLLKDL